MRFLYHNTGKEQPPMTEITLATEIAKLIQGYGVVGVVAALIVYLVWQDRRRTKKEAADRVERQVNSDADRLMWTNHLSGMIKESSSSNRELAIGLTRLSESVNNFQTRCGNIQDDLQNEVDRLRKG
jgi:hypothetical protein